MPDIRTIVQRMVDANESDDDINAVIERYKELNPPKPQAPPAAPAQKIAPDEEDSFFGGFTKSLFSGEALGAGLQGAIGYAKGAIADLPSTIVGGVQDAFEAVSDPSRTIREAPGAFREGIPEVARMMMDTTSRAGSDPEAFGRMVGQFTGQPLATAGAIKGAPMLRKPIGATVEGAGRLMRKHQPITGMAPRVLEPRIARTMERGVGAGIEKAGQFIRGNRQPPKPPPNAGGILSKEKVLAIEDQFADILEDVRTTDTDLKSTELGVNRSQPSVSYPRPARAELSDNLDFDVTTGEVRPIPGSRLNRNPTRLTPEEELARSVEEVRQAFEHIERTKPIELPPAPYSQGAASPPEQPRTAFSRRTSTSKPEKNTKTQPKKEEPASKEKFEPSNDPKTTVDTTTGEITEAPTMEGLANELKAQGVDYKELVRKSRAKWNLGDLFKGEEGSATIPKWADSVAEWMTKRKPVNPLRPEVPEGQVTNRRMIELSNEIDADNRAAGQRKSLFSPGASEHAPDLIPETTTDIFEGVSPTFKPRQSFADIEKRMYELTDKGTAGTLTAEELAEAQSLNKIWRNHPEFNKPAPEPELSFFDRQKRLAISETGSIGDDVKQRTIGQPSPLASRLVKDGDVVRTQVKDVGPRGQSFTVTSPDGKKLGEIAVTNERVEEVLKAYGGDGNPDDIAKLIYETDLEDILEQHGFKDTDLPRMKVESKSNREKGAKTQVLNKPAQDPEKVEAKATEPKPEPVKEELPKIDPDAAFAKGGDVKPIVEEARRLDQTKAVDNKYKALLPKELRFELGPGETYKGRLKDLTQIIQEADSASPEESALKVAARDKFLESVRTSMGKEPVSNEPPLNFKDLKPSDFRTPIEGRLKRLLQDKTRSKPEVWTSPKKPPKS